MWSGGVLRVGSDEAATVEGVTIGAREQGTRALRSTGQGGARATAGTLKLADLHDLVVDTAGDERPDTVRTDTESELSVYTQENALEPVIVQFQDVPSRSSQSINRVRPQVTMEARAIKSRPMKTQAVMKTSWSVAQRTSRGPHKVRMIACSSVRGIHLIRRCMLNLGICTS